jgi:hypothetical protein
MTNKGNLVDLPEFSEEIYINFMENLLFSDDIEKRKEIIY